jgi:putative membrane protein
MVIRVASGRLDIHNGIHDGKLQFDVREEKKIFGHYFYFMNGVVRFLLNGLAVLLTAYLLPGVDVEHYGYALLVAVLLAIVNAVIKPILVLLTIPITFVTFGLFLLVINALMILLVDWLITSGFEVDGFWWALAFSLILSLFNSLFSDLTKQQVR